MTKTGKVNKLKQHIDKPFLEIHPHDALARNIAVLATLGRQIDELTLLGAERFGIAGDVHRLSPLQFGKWRCK